MDGHFGEYFFNSVLLTSTTVLVTVFLAALLTHAVMIVGALANPFTGDFKVQPTAYQTLLQSFDQERAK